MSDVFLRVFLGVLGGFLMGCGFVFLRFRSGLTREEWGYLREVYTCLRAGEYDYIKEDEDERSDNNEKH